MRLFWQSLSCDTDKANLQHPDKPQKLNLTKPNQPWFSRILLHPVRQRIGPILTIFCVNLYENLDKKYDNVGLVFKWSYECFMLSLAVRLRLFYVACILSYLWFLSHLFFEQINDDDDDDDDRCLADPVCLWSESDGVGLPCNTVEDTTKHRDLLTLKIKLLTYLFTILGNSSPNLHLASSEQRCWSGGREILTELSLCYSLVLCSISGFFQQCTLHNHNEQFFQVGLLDRALISALRPSSQSSKHLCIFELYGAM